MTTTATATATARKVLARKEHSQGGRKLVVVDIENAIGGAAINELDVAAAKRRLLGAISIGDYDQIVIGTSHVGLIPVGCAWHGLRYVVRSGPDGADLALLEVLEEDIARRFRNVVVVSGDGIFTDGVAALGREGVAVTVVANRNSMSRRLALAASHVIYLDYDTSPPDLQNKAAA